MVICNNSPIATFELLRPILSIAPRIDADNLNFANKKKIILIPDVELNQFQNVLVVLNH